MNTIFFDDEWFIEETYKILNSICQMESVCNIFNNNVTVLPTKRNSLSVEETPCIWFNISANSPYDKTITDNEIEEYSLVSIQIEIYVSDEEKNSSFLYLKNMIKQQMQKFFNMKFIEDREATSYVDKVKRRLLVGRALIDNINKIFYTK